MDNELSEKTVYSYDDRRDIIIPGDAENTVRTCAELFLKAANHAIQSHGNFCVALAGGSSPKALFKKLSEEPFRNQTDWSKVYLFWSDERCVPPDHPESNYHMAMHAGLSTLPIPKRTFSA